MLMVLYNAVESEGDNNVRLAVEYKSRSRRCCINAVKNAGENNVQLARKYGECSEK